MDPPFDGFLVFVCFITTGGSFAYSDIKSRIPVQRIGRRLDIGHAALFLVSDAASFVTGHTLVVDGGSWMTSINGMSGIADQLDVIAAISRSKL